MAGSTQFTVRLIAASAAGYAASAANRLIEDHPETSGQFGPEAFSDWKAHLEQRLTELSAALVAEDPGLFLSEVKWSATAFRARELPLLHLRASLECLRDTLAQELPSIGGDLPRQYLEAAISALEGSPATPEAAPTTDEEVSRLGLLYLEAALRGDRSAAKKVVLGAVEQGLAVETAFDALMFAQKQVGEMWHRHELAVAQEHFVTEVTRSLVALLAERGQASSPVGKTVVVASAPGNQHDIGPRVVAAHFQMAGWRTIHLAEAMPAAEIALGLEAFEADLLALSMSLSTQLESTIELVSQARARMPDLKVLAGGRSLVQSPQLCERMGADGWCRTAAEAPRVGAELVGFVPAES